MTKEQEVIKYIETRIEICNENADICDDNDFDEEATYLREESYMLETVLNMLKEKDKEIERLRYIKKSFDYVVQKETEKKDRQIDLMADKLVGETFEIDEYTEIVLDNKEQIKQYYERKSEE